MLFSLAVDYFSGSMFSPLGNKIKTKILCKIHACPFTGNLSESGGEWTIYRYEMRSDIYQDKAYL